MWFSPKLVVLLSTILIASAARVYEGAQLYEIVPSSDAQNALLHTLAQQEPHYDFFSLSRGPGQPAQLLVRPPDQEKFAQWLRQHKVAHKILNTDFGRSIAHEVAVNRLLRQLLPYTGNGRLGTERYYTHAEINSYIQDLAEQYPNRVFVKAVGQSYEKRIMKTITITNGDGRTGKNVVLMDGGFHAREWISPAAVLYVIEQLVENFSENGHLLLDYDWVILPVVNPDGYEFTQIDGVTRLWRKTRKPNVNHDEDCWGTDPNRNFDFHWNEEGASPKPCSNTYAGPKPFSEPETVVVRDIMHTLRGRGVMYLTVHSYGSLILYPWGWTSDLPDTWEDLHDVGKAGGDAMLAATGANYTVGSSTNVLYIAAGASDDYAFNDGFPLSYTLELPKGGPNGFDPPPNLIDGIVKETWIGIRGMAQRAVEKYPLHKN